MATVLLTSDFLLSLPESGNVVVTGKRGDLRASRWGSPLTKIRPGDKVFILDRFRQIVTSASLVLKMCDPDQRELPPIRGGLEGMVILGPPSPLETPITKAELIVFNNRLPMLVRMNGGGMFQDNGYSPKGKHRIRFKRTSFCMREPPSPVTEELLARQPNNLREHPDTPLVSEPPAAAPAGDTHLPVRRRLRSAVPSRGPVPSSWKETVERDVDGEGHTYLLRFGSSDVWKIGWTSDPERRLREINSHIPVGYIDERWAVHSRRAWPSKQQAFAAEQSFIDRMYRHSVGGEQFSASEAEILDAWRSVTAQAEDGTAMPVRLRIRPRPINRAAGSLTE